MDADVVGVAVFLEIIEREQGDRGGIVPGVRVDIIDRAVAFQKGLGLIHSMAHALSTHHDLHHGLANALMLKVGLEFSLQDLSETEIIKLAQALRSKTSDIKGILKAVDDLLKELEIPESLEAAGVVKPNLSALSNTALADPCHTCNRREVTLDDFQKLFQKVL